VFDSHAHLDHENFDIDRTDVIARAKEEGVKGILCVCSDLRNTGVFMELLQENDLIRGAAGIHPHDAKDAEELWETLEIVLGFQGIVALGEIGLDYHYENSPRDIQKEVFRRQLKIARKKSLPFIIHCREAIPDTLQILKESGLISGRELPEKGEVLWTGVMHCYSGSEKDLKSFLDMGLYISIAGPVTFPGAIKTRAVANSVPLDRLLVETDCPYLSPHPVRGRRNEPAYLKYIVEEIARIKGSRPEEVERATTENAKALFCL